VGGGIAPAGFATAAEAMLAAATDGTVATTSGARSVLGAPLGAAPSVAAQPRPSSNAPKVAARDNTLV
jgi:hypothetical protein